MIMILNNKHDATSRDFVEANPGYRVVDWYDNESQDKMLCDILGVSAVSAFPSVVDTDTRRIASLPSSMEDAIRTLQGMGESDIKSTLVSKINARTEALIVSGVDHSVGGKTLRFSLSLEDQANINALYVSRDDASMYPVVVKGSNEAGLEELSQIASSAEVVAFYKACFAHVRARLAEGWALKGSLSGMSYEDMLAFADPRG